MEAILDWIRAFELAAFIRAVGYLGILIITFAESGLFIGFFLPGDSLLFTAGFLASQGYFSLLGLMTVSFTGAVLGDTVGYAFGKKVGPAIFSREDSMLFHKDHLERSRAFYAKHGAKTIVLARFMPVVRTFAPILAGVGEMPYRTFVFYNFFGGALWALGLTALGYVLGATVPDIDRYLLPIILAIVFVSILPAMLKVLRSKESRDRIIGFIRAKISSR
jgi:membrane-associated protein